MPWMRIGRLPGCLRGDSVACVLIGLPRLAGRRVCRVRVGGLAVGHGSSPDTTGRYMARVPFIARLYVPRAGRGGIAGGGAVAGVGILISGRGHYMSRVWIVRDRVCVVRARRVHRDRERGVGLVGPLGSRVLPVRRATTRQHGCGDERESD